MLPTPASSVVSKSQRNQRVWPHYEIFLYLALWYTISLLALWANKYLIYSIGINTNLLSLTQLTMSVLCGIVLERRNVGSHQFKMDLQASFSIPKDDSSTNRLKNMLTLGFVRIFNLVFDLVALKYISVSLAQTIKSSAPFFTVILTYLVLGKSTTWTVATTLVPIVVGLGCCSLSAVAGLVSPIGILAALSSNCSDCLQNVLSKKFLTTYSVSQLQLYSSIVAASLQSLFVAYTAFLPGSSLLLARKNDLSPSILAVVLCINGVAYFVQSALAYKIMSMLSPVSHSVASTLKRAMLMILSIFRYGESVTLLNWFGITLVLMGVYFFSYASKEASKQAKSTEKDTIPISPLQDTHVAIV